MTSTPNVSVFSWSDPSKKVTEVPLPGVFSAPIRNDIVHFVHSNLAKNSRQARGVDPLAGMRHAAISWGPGRAVARIPRVTGSGSQRTGQAAFGNMTRKGRMFAPLKTWRRWHRKVNLNQRRQAQCSALAASALVPLVMARGHRVNNVPSIPLVLDDTFQSVEKTSEAMTCLEAFGLLDDVNRCKKSRVLRPGKGKARGRRYKERQGPLFVYNDANCKVAKALRNIPGVSVAHVQHLNIKQLAPGSHLGRLIVWTQSAFQSLNGLYGTSTEGSQLKQGFVLQRSCLSNADVQRIINSNEIQSVCRDKRAPRTLHHKQKKNPFRNKQAMKAVNPFYAQQKAFNAGTASKHRKNRQNLRKKGLGISKCQKQLSKEQQRTLCNQKQNSKGWYSDVMKKIQAAEE